MTREQLQAEFLKNNMLKIIKEFLKNENKIGLVEVFADEQFQLSSISFIEGSFDSNEFISFPSNSIANVDINVNEAFYMYFTILWFDNKTKWNLKTLAMQGDTNINSLLIKGDVDSNSLN